MFEGIRPGELLTVVEDTRRDDATLWARRMTAIAGLLWHHTAAAEGLDTTDPSYALITGFARTVADLGASLNITPAAATTLVNHAEALDTRHPRILDLLARQQIDWTDVKTILTRTNCVDPAVVRKIDTALADRIAGWQCWSTHRLRNTIDATITRLDPDGVKERRATADTDTRVTYTALPNGMGRVNVYVPAPVAAMFDHRVTTMATAVCPHDPRTLDQRRAAAIGALGEGHFTVSCHCGRDECPIPPPEVAGTGRFVINVVASADTLTGRTEDPGYMDGYGVIDADHIRDLADHGALLRPTTMTATQTGAELLRHPPSAAVARGVRARSLTCSFPGCTRSAWKADLDHTTAFDHDNPLRGGWTMPGNLDATCRQHHRLKTFDCGWNDQQLADGTIIWTSPTGRTYRSTPDGADLFDDIAAALTPPRPRNHRRDKTRRTATTRAGLTATRATNTETRRLNTARAHEISQRQWRNSVRTKLHFFKGSPSTSAFCRWVNQPHENETITADWKPPPKPPTPDDDKPPF